MVLQNDSIKQLECLMWFGRQLVKPPLFFCIELQVDLYHNI